MEPRFAALYGLDPATQKRTPRPSASLYRRILQARGVSDDLLAQFGDLLGPEPVSTTTAQRLFTDV